MIQVPQGFYSPSTYDEWHRWVSYWYQIQSIIRTGAKSLLEIGPGTGVTGQYLAQRCRIQVTTFDHDESLRPNVVGDIRELDRYFEPNSYDCVCAFQVLEHLPYDHFLSILRQILSISRNYFVFSLPHWGYFFQFRFWFIRWNFTFGRKIARPYSWEYDGQHYWEIGTRGFSLRRILRTTAQVFDIRRHYFCPDYPYHYFFECTKRENNDKW